MRASPYDSQGDGRCDAIACRAVLAIAVDSPIDRAKAAAVEGSPRDRGNSTRDLQSRLRCRLEGDEAYRARDIERVAARLPRPSRMFVDLLQGGAAVEPAGLEFPTANFSNLGTNPAQLRRWGYTITKTPSIDGMIARCASQTGTAETRCWAALDEYVMDDVIAIVPYSFPSLRLVRRLWVRVRNVNFDLAYPYRPVLDRIILRPA